MTPWARTVVIGLAVAIISAGGTSLLTGWMGSGVGVGGVRQALIEHEADAAVHPNVGQLEERLGNMQRQQQATDAKVEGVQQSVDKLSAEVLRSLGKLEGKIDAQE